MNLYFTIKEGHAVRTSKKTFEELSFKYQDKYCFEKESDEDIIPIIVTVFSESYRDYRLFENDDVWEELMYKIGVDITCEYYSC